MRCPLRFCLIVLLGAIVLTSNAADAQSRSRRGADPPTVDPALVEVVRSELQGIADALRTSGDVTAAGTAMASLWDRAITYVPDEASDLLTDLAFMRRLIALLDRARDDATPDIVRFLLDHGSFARALAFVAHPAHDDEAAMMRLINRFRTERAEYVDRYAALAAAICVVRDSNPVMRVNENRVHRPDPIAVFDYYVANEKRMYFGVRDLPTELLVYVVDVAASIEEMQWALDRYAGNDNVGRLFFEIDYDYDHLEGQTKESTAAGWNLPAILQHGGVCADQAYFAVTVGKAIGVPATYTVGRSASVSHAWVGFVQANRRAAWWNFNSGRYEAYQNLQGQVTDPQTVKITPDSTVSLRAAHVQTPRVDRDFGTALVDAATRLEAARGKPGRRARELDTRPFPGVEAVVVRSPTLTGILDVLRTALTRSPGDRAGWAVLHRHADDDEFTLEQRKAWGESLHRLCGKRYLDFYLEIATPMIEAEGDLDEQNRLWNAAFDQFRSRPDLAAAVRMRQGAMWLKAGRTQNAGQCFETVVMSYANDGPWILDALQQTEQILRKRKDGRRLLLLYERAWNLTERPQDAMAVAFIRQCNWYRVGTRYALIEGEFGSFDHMRRIQQELKKFER